MTVDMNALQSLGLAPAATTAATRASSNQLSQDQFFKLMTAQLNNQNPLNPQDSAQFLSQMAQFSTVSGIQELQNSFSSFAASMQQDQSLAASNLVGHSASVLSDKALLPSGGSMSGELVLPADASAVTLKIIDASGKPVKTVSLGAQSQGSVPFRWDGTLDGGGALAAPGMYQIQAEAVIGGQNTALETQATAPVSGVKLGGAKGMQVELQGLGSFSMSDIQSIN